MAFDVKLVRAACPALGDPLDAGIIAADRWTGANRFGTTLAEERAGEPLEQLLAEEEPDLDPYAEATDDEDGLARRGDESEPRAGRLYVDESGWGEDEEADAVASDAGIDGVPGVRRKRRCMRRCIWSTIPTAQAPAHCVSSEA